MNLDQIPNVGVLGLSIVIILREIFAFLNKRQANHIHITQSEVNEFKRELSEINTKLSVMTEMLRQLAR